MMSYTCIPVKENLGDMQSCRMPSYEFGVRSSRVVCARMDSITFCFVLCDGSCLQICSYALYEVKNK
jgi:hypothetical protein